MDLQLTDYISLDRVLARMRSATKQEALVELGELVSTGMAPGLTEQIISVLGERERLASTGIGEEIAIPHGKLEGVDRLVVALGCSREGVEFDAVDGKLTRLFFVLLAPINDAKIHLRALARISRMCKETEFRARLLKARDSMELFDALCGAEARMSA